MKCISITYRNENPNHISNAAQIHPNSIDRLKQVQQNEQKQILPLKTSSSSTVIKRNVDSYYEKIIQNNKQQKQKQLKAIIEQETTINRSKLLMTRSSLISSQQGHRSNKMATHVRKVYGSIPSLNIMKVQRKSESDLMRLSRNSEDGGSVIEEGMAKKFRSSMYVQRQHGTNSNVKKTASMFSLKGLMQLSQQRDPSNSHHSHQQCLHQKQIERDFFINGKKQQKLYSKLKALKSIQLYKPKTILLSIDFIIDQTTFWSQEFIDENCHKKWKILQEHCNIVWLVKRENSFKKLQKYVTQHKNLRLDGVYQIVSKKNEKSLKLSLFEFEKDLYSSRQQKSNNRGNEEISTQLNQQQLEIFSQTFKQSPQLIKKKSSKKSILINGGRGFSKSKQKRNSLYNPQNQSPVNPNRPSSRSHHHSSEITVINSLISSSSISPLNSLNKNFGYEQFYNSFPVLVGKNLNLKVHFIQIDLNDKQRFNTVLKILSIQRLPYPNSVKWLFQSFDKMKQQATTRDVQTQRQNFGKSFVEEKLTKLQKIQSMSAKKIPSTPNESLNMQKQDFSYIYEKKRTEIMEHFSQHLRLNLNTKIKYDDNLFSLQFLIGDMLKRNVKMLCASHIWTIDVNKKMKILRNQPPELFQGQKSPQLQKLSSLSEISLQKLSQSQGRLDHSKLYQEKTSTPHYDAPVYIWKK